MAVVRTPQPRVLMSGKVLLFYKAEQRPGCSFLLRERIPAWPVGLAWGSQDCAEVELGLTNLLVYAAVMAQYESFRLGVYRLAGFAI